MCFFNVILLFNSYIFIFKTSKFLFLITVKCDKSVIKNQKNSFLLQPAILIFAFSLKLTDENILQLVKTIH
ncbi:hypothetical protein IWX84_002853 [Flavobacterium sp. CG_9.10]|nr:hypothetical protein [Flavobacterium sp. CG_9.10]